MSLENPQDSLYDPIRKKWIKTTPEEKVRQYLIRWMLDEGSYPKTLLKSEGSWGLKARRRFDLACFKPSLKLGNPEPFLLLVECKAHPPTSEDLIQLCGYAQTVQSPYMALAYPGGVFSRFLSDDQWKSGLLNFEDLLRELKT